MRAQPVDVLAVRTSEITLFGESRPTYFIDLIEGRHTRNLRSTKDPNEARQIARGFGVQYGAKVIA